jgi:hypothetical protein
MGPSGDNPVVVLRGVDGWKVTDTAGPAGAKEFVRNLDEHP